MRRSALSYLEHEATRKCPKCGLPLIFNNSLCDAYWLQCRGFGQLKQAGDADCSFQVLAGRDEVDAERKESIPCGS